MSTRCHCVAPDERGRREFEAAALSLFATTSNLVHLVPLTMAIWKTYSLIVERATQGFYGNLGSVRADLP